MCSDCRKLNFFSGGGAVGMGGSACSPASKKWKSVFPPTPMQPAHLRSLIKVFLLHEPFMKLVKLINGKARTMVCLRCCAG